MNSSEKHIENEHILKIIFLCLVVFSLLIGVVLTGIVINKSGGIDDELQYIEKWIVTDTDGKSFEVGRSYNDDRALNDDFTIVSRLPENVGSKSVLCFQNRSDVKVYINGALRKEFVRTRDTGIPGGSLKEFYMTIPLNENDKGAELKIIRGKTDWNPFVVSETFITSEDGIYNYMLKEYGLPFFVSLSLFAASVMVVLIGFILRIRRKKTINMIYGAFGILIVSCWLLAVSQYTPFITKIYYIDGLMGYLFSMMIPFPFLIYINSIQKHRYHTLFVSMFILSLVSFILWTVLHFAGILSFQKSLYYIDAVLVIEILCVYIIILIDVKKGYIKEYLYIALGFAAFMIMAIIQIILLVFFNVSINWIPLLLGLLFLLVCIIIQQIYDLNNIGKQLYEEINRQTAEKLQIMHIVQILADTIDAKDAYTNGHSSRVARYSKEIARRYGYGEKDLNDIYMIGLLHDIGKIGIPDAVINKTTALTDEEYDLIKQHPAKGAKILDNIKEMAELSMGARWHHERFDGSGYPDGISGEEIPEKTRIIAVADAYDAMTSYRSYREPMPQDIVRSEIKKGSGTQFDSRFAEIMLQMIDEDKDYTMRETKD